MSREQVDYNDPRHALEEQEENESKTEHDHDLRDFSAALAKILSWQLEGNSPAEVGYRTYLLCHIIRPEIIGGISLESIATLIGMGHGRSDAHKLSKQASELFNLKGMHQRSEEIKRNQSKAWDAKHGNY